MPQQEAGAAALGVCSGKERLGGCDAQRSVRIVWRSAGTGGVLVEELVNRRIDVMLVDKRLCEREECLFAFSTRSESHTIL